jgi:hypothetical protein
MNPFDRELGETQSVCHQGGVMQVRTESVAFLPTNSANAQSIGAEDELSPTLAKGGGESGNKPSVAIGFKAGQSKDGGLGDEREVSPCISAKMSGWEPTLAQDLKGENNDTHKNRREVLFRLWSKIGAQAFQEWALGRLRRFQAQEVLQHEVHGKGDGAKAAQKESMLDDGTLSCKEKEAENILRDMWGDATSRHSSQGRELAQQLARELTVSMQKLSLEKAQASDIGCMKYIVRRLTPTECCRLMGLQDGYTIPTGLRRFFDANGEPAPELVAEFQRTFDTFGAIMAEYEHKPASKPKSANQVRAWLEKITDPATCPDSPRYKACGNGWATNQPRWILARLLALGEGIDPFTGEEL